jgi:hypothetical protein
MTSRRLHNEGLNDLSVLLTKYYSGDRIKKIEMGGGRSTYAGEERCMHVFLVWKHEGKKPLRRPRCRGEDNIKMYYETQNQQVLIQICEFILV